MESPSTAGVTGSLALSVEQLVAGVPVRAELEAGRQFDVAAHGGGIPSRREAEYSCAGVQLDALGACDAADPLGRLEVERLDVGLRSQHQLGAVGHGPTIARRPTRPFCRTMFTRCGGSVDTTRPACGPFPPRPGAPM